MFQDDYGRKKGFFSDYLTGIVDEGRKAVEEYDREQKGKGFVSDLFAGVTKDSAKAIAKSAASESAKAISTGVFEGTKKTLNEGGKKAGKKAVDKVFGEGVISPEKEEEEKVDNWEMIAPYAKKVMDKCRGKERKKKGKKKTTNIEKELAEFFEI